MTSVTLERKCTTKEPPEHAVETARKYLERLTFAVLHGQPALVMRRGSDWGSRYSAAPRSWLSEIRLSVQPRSPAGSSIAATLEVTSPSAVVSSRDRAALDQEMDGLVAALTGEVPERQVTRDDRMAVVEKTNRARHAASWFYVIAAMSLINSLLSVYQANASFLAGLGVSQLIEAASLALRESANPRSSVVILGAGLMLNVVVSAAFALFGLLASRGSRRAFVVGMVIFGLDTVLVLWFRDYVGIVYHLIVLHLLFSGLRAGRDAGTKPKTGSARP
jgi:hypothetical protein